MFADLITRPAGDGPVIHFRRGRVVHSRAVKLLVLLEAVAVFAAGIIIVAVVVARAGGTPAADDAVRAGGVRVLRLRHLHKFAGVVEGPMKRQRGWVTLDGAQKEDGLLLQGAHHYLAFSLLANRGI